MSADPIERHSPIPIPFPANGESFDPFARYWYEVVHGALVVTPRVGTPAITADDLPELPPGYRDEIINGRLVVTPAPVWDHQRIALRLAMLLEAQAPIGWRAAPDVNIKIDLADDEFSRPDLCLMRPGERGGLWHTYRQFGLLVEIASPSTRWVDDDDKLVLYAGQAVPAYWQILPDANGGAPTVIVHMEPDPDGSDGDGPRYTRTITVQPGEKLGVEVPFPFTVEPDLLVP
jgi:Uma2 family endonuclease